MKLPWIRPSDLIKIIIIVMIDDTIQSMKPVLKNFNFLLFLHRDASVQCVFGFETHKNLQFLSKNTNFWKLCALLPADPSTKFTNLTMYFKSPLLCAVLRRSRRILLETNSSRVSFRPRCLDGGSSQTEFSTSVTKSGAVAAEWWQMQQGSMAGYPSVYVFTGDKR